MDIRYYMKIQNSHNTKTKREKDLAIVNKYADKHFNDTFDTDTVLLNGNPIQMMIIKDTDGNTYKKKIKTRHSDKINLGDYVVWNGQHWLITLLDYDDKTWNRGYMYMCPTVLRWINDNGEFVERWAYTEDFTKYATGEFGNNTITRGEYQFGFTLPVDDETKYVKRGKRFAIDLEGVEPPDVYELTNRKILLNDATSFKRGGTLVWTLSFSEFNSDTDKKVELKDDRSVWICDYSSTAVLDDNFDESIISLKITHKGTNSIVAGGNSKSFTLVATDTEGNDIDISSVDWKITTLPENELFVKTEIVDGKTIKIGASYDSTILGTKILLTAFAFEQEANLYIDIGGGI